MLCPTVTPSLYTTALSTAEEVRANEYFLMIHAERCTSTAQFLMKAQLWQDIWNCHRPNYGIAMHGLTPQEKLKASNAIIQSHVLQFPVLLMENVLKSLGVFTAALKLHSTGKYVHTKCRYWNITVPYQDCDILAPTAGVLITSAYIRSFRRMH
jgi:hypothetical protein